MAGCAPVLPASGRNSLPVLAADPVPATATATAPKTKPAAKTASAAAQVTPDEEIVVRARKRDQMQVSSGGQLGALGNKKGLDVPFNIRSYNSSLILNQQSQTLGEVLENDPSVRTTFGYGNFSEMFVIRGLRWMATTCRSTACTASPPSARLTRAV